jgi:site-specific DNA recombinase
MNRSHTHIIERFSSSEMQSMRGRKAKGLSSQRRVVAYVRVSTDEQSRDGVSLDAQRARIEAFAVATARTIDEVIVDAGESAKSLTRPGMQRILQAVAAGDVGTVIVLKLDRLTRSVRDLGDLLERFTKADAALVSVSESLDTSSAAGRMVVNVLGTFAQFEREVIGERTSIALTHKRSLGEVYGSTPYGYRREGSRLVPDVERLDTLAVVRELWSDGTGLSLQGIADHLNAQQIPASRGGAWFKSSVRAVLRSRMTLEAVA